MKRGKKRTEIKIRLSISGFSCPPEEVTQVLGLSPTKTWRRNDSIPRTIMVYKENGWRLEAPGSPYASVEKQCTVLMERITPRLEAFKELPPGSEVELSCVIYVYHNERPSLSFSPEVIRTLATIGGLIDIDYYDLSDATP